MPGNFLFALIKIGTKSADKKLLSDKRKGRKEER